VAVQKPINNNLPSTTVEINGRKTTAAPSNTTTVKTKNSRRQPNQVESTHVIDSKRHVKKSQ